MHLGNCPTTSGPSAWGGLPNFKNGDWLIRSLSLEQSVTILWQKEITQMVAYGGMIYFYFNFFFFCGWEERWSIQRYASMWQTDRRYCVTGGQTDLPMPWQAVVHRHISASENVAAKGSPVSWMMSASSIISPKRSLPGIVWHSGSVYFLSKEMFNQQEKWRLQGFSRCYMRWTKTNDNYFCSHVLRGYVDKVTNQTFLIKMILCFVLGIMKMFFQCKVLDVVHPNWCRWAVLPTMLWCMDCSGCPNFHRSAADMTQRPQKQQFTCTPQDRWHRFSLSKAHTKGSKAGSLFQSTHRGTTIRLSCVRVRVFFHLCS